MAHLKYLRDLKTNSTVEETSDIDPLLYAVGGALFGSLFTYLYLQRQAQYSRVPITPPNLGARVLSAEGGPKSTPLVAFKSMIRNHNPQQGAFDYRGYFNQLNTHRAGYFTNHCEAAGGYYLS